MSHLAAALQQNRDAEAFATHLNQGKLIPLLREIIDRQNADTNPSTNFLEPFINDYLNVLSNLLHVQISLVKTYLRGEEENNADEELINPV